MAGILCGRKLKKVSTNGGVVVAGGRRPRLYGSVGLDDTIIFNQRHISQFPRPVAIITSVPVSQASGSTGALRLPEFMPGGEPAGVWTNAGAVTVSDASIRC